MIKKILAHKLQVLLFVLIVILASALRLYQIQNLPPGVNRDEAAIGYTAYSLLHTGRDEYGKFLPLAFESFGDWKLPLYIYTTVGSVFFFGLNEFAVRLPSALAGIGMVILSYFLVKELTKNNKLAFLSMAVMAIAPWAIHFSRVAEESNLAAFLITAAVLLFLKSFKKTWLAILSAVLFALTYFTYAGNYVFTTLLVFGLVCFYWKNILKTKATVTAVGIFLLLSLMIGMVNLSANHTKISGIGIFGDPSIVHAQIELPRLQYSNPNSFAAKFFHNRIIYGTQQFFINYANAFSPQFLFEVGGTNHAHNIENFGNAYLIEFPFFFLGLVSLFVLQKGKEKKLILWWLLISPVAASITKDAPHSARMFAVFPIFSIVIAMGIIYVLNLFKQKIVRLAAFSVLIILYTVNLGIYLDTYYVHFPINEAESWGYIYRDLYTQLQKTEFNNKQIVISKPTYSPYIFLLFYSHYDPTLYQRQAVRYPATSDGFYHVKQFGKYIFEDIDWQRDLQQPNTVLVNDYITTPENIRTYQTDGTYLPSGQPMFSIITTK